MKFLYLSIFRFDLAPTFSAHVFGPVFLGVKPTASKATPGPVSTMGNPLWVPQTCSFHNFHALFQRFLDPRGKWVEWDQQGLECWGCWGYAKSHGFTWKFHSGTFRYLSDSWTTSAMNCIAISVAICWLDPAQHVAVICGVSFLLLSPC